MRNRWSVLALSTVLIGGHQGLSAALVEGTLKVWYPVNKGSDIRLDLSKQSGTFAVKWWNPRKSDGGGLQDGSVTKISGGGTRSLGNPPSDHDSSWAALLLLTN